jgi:YVTN family beta-propeller protein
VNELPSGTVTLLFTDIEGSTALLKQLRDRYGELLDDHRRLMRAAFEAHGGREIDTQGDAFFIAFPRAKDAVAAAVEAQEALAAHTWPDGVRVRVRMGIHTGEPLLGSEGYHGLGLHRGARICSAGHGGQILLSNTTRELIEDDLLDGVELMDLGERRLKDIDRPERLAQVVYPGMPASFPPLKTAADAPFEGREEELADAVAVRFGWVRRRRRSALLIVALAAAGAVAVVLLAGGSDGPISVEANALAVLSVDGKRLSASVPTGTSPGGVALGEGSIWVTNTGEGTVSRVDPENNEVVQTIPVGTAPVGVAVEGGFVWVANSADGTVSQIDPRKAGGAEIGRVRVGNQPNAIAAGDGVVWVANAGDHSLSRIDPRTGRASKPVSAGTGADALAVGEGRVWVASYAGATVSEVDPSSGRVLRPISVGYGPSSVAVGGGAVWVVNSLDGTVSKIDPERSSVAAALEVGREPQSVAARGDAVWVTDEAGVLTRIAARRGAVVDRIRLGSRPGALVVGAHGVYVGLRGTARSHRGGTLRVVMADPVVSKTNEILLDPATAYSSLGVALTALLTDGLVAFRHSAGTAGVQVVPDLATSIPTPTDGGRTWTFRVRRGIRYSNGEMFVASDIRHGIERGLALPDGTARFILDSIDGIRADDAAGTITFRLTRADPDFLAKLAYTSGAAVPRSTPARAVKGGVPGTGPYRIARLTKKQVLLERNPYFRERSAAAQPLPYPDRIEITPDTKANDQLRAVERGDADLAFDGEWASPDKLEPLGRQRASQVHVNPIPGAAFAFLNVRMPPFDDVRVRRAVNFAINRDALRRVGVPNCQILPRGFVGYERYCPYRYDLAHARRLVAASGTKGAKVEVRSPPIVPSGTPKQLMTMVASALRTLGYRVRLTVAKAHWTIVNKKRTQAGFFGWFTDVPTTSGFISPLFTCGSGANVGNFCDHGIDAQMRRASRLQTTDPTGAAELWARIDHTLTDRAPWVPLVTTPSIKFVSERVGNFQYNPQWGPLFDQMWVK